MPERPPPLIPPRNASGGQRRRGRTQPAHPTPCVQICNHLSREPFRTPCPDPCAALTPLPGQTPGRPSEERLSPGRGHRAERQEPPIQAAAGAYRLRPEPRRQPQRHRPTTAAIPPGGREAGQDGACLRHAPSPASHRPQHAPPRPPAVAADGPPRPRATATHRSPHRPPQSHEPRGLRTGPSEHAQESTP